MSGWSWKGVNYACTTPEALVSGTKRWLRRGSWVRCIANTQAVNGFCYNCFQNCFQTQLHNNVKIEFNIKHWEFLWTVVFQCLNNQFLPVKHSGFVFGTSRTIYNACSNGARFIGLVAFTTSTTVDDAEDGAGFDSQVRFGCYFCMLQLFRTSCYCSALWRQATGLHAEERQFFCMLCTDKLSGMLDSSKPFCTLSADKLFCMLSNTQTVCMLSTENCCTLQVLLQYRPIGNGYQLQYSSPSGTSCAGSVNISVHAR